MLLCTVNKLASTFEAQDFSDQQTSTIGTTILPLQWRLKLPKRFCKHLIKLAGNKSSCKHFSLSSSCLPPFHLLTFPQTKLRPNPPPHPQSTSHICNLPRTPKPQQTRSAGLPLPRLRSPHPLCTVLHPDAKTDTRQTLCKASFATEMVPPSQHQENDY